MGNLDDDSISCKKSSSPRQIDLCAGEDTDVSSDTNSAAVGEGFNNSHRFYAPYIKEFARELRKNQTAQETALWNLLKNNQMGYKFRHQFAIDNKYVADFVCLEKRLIIELDCGQHNSSINDIDRTLYLEKENFRVIRFWNNEIDNNIEGCYEVILREIETPHPNPLPHKGQFGGARECTNLLLTGSGGFIGKNLKSYLQNKYKLLTPRSYELNLIDEQAVKKYFDEHDIDFIIHCGSTGGARGIDDKDSTIEDNLAMVDNILKYKKPNSRVILFGSGAMYDKSRTLHKVKEDEIGTVVPKDLYGKSKMLIAQKIKDRKDVVCLNIFACYGYGEKENRFPSYAINRVLEGKDIEINQNVIFDYLFVEDMQRIVEHFITNIPVSNIINITPTESISLYDIAQIVKTFSDKDIRISIKNPVMNNEYTGDNSRLLSEIENFKFTSIKEGLKKLYTYNQKIELQLI